ncbi:Putative F-box/LRR-repeat protein At5g02930 [Linum grandiflorum]
MAAGGDDRISNLPDSIIHHILSFIDTTSAVRTSVLSKQWKSAWKHVHALNMELKFDEYSRYERFVDKLLSLRHSYHVSKVFWSPDGYEFSLLTRVVQYSVSHGAQHFDLRHSHDNVPNTPLLELFDSASDFVRTLKVVCFDFDCRPVCSCRFQLLTTLELVLCWFLTDRELVEPFSQFPCLKDLVLHDCPLISPDDDGLDVRLRVSGLELERLSLLYIDEWKLEIFAPKLKSFKLASLGDMEFSELTLPSLVHADIESGREYGSGEDYDIQKADLVSMFSGLYNVEYLTLCKEISEAVRRQSKFLEQQSCPFTKLKKLNMEFDSSHDIPYKVLNHYFLNGCSNASLNIQSLEKGSWSIMSERLP